MRLLVTGANGFVGKPLCKTAASTHQVIAAVRQDGLPNSVLVGDINEATDWSAALRNVDVVIHLAARVHVMNETSADPLAEFRRVNTAGTAHLARCAVAAGVKRLVYVSSIKVNGEQSESGFSETDTPNPQDPYGLSKWEAEQQLHDIAQQTGLEIVVVRPPLVYGPEVKGNFISLFKAIAKGIPLPFAGAKNARSLVYVGNLVDALLTCATHPAAAGQTYLVSDGEALSTAQLAQHIAQALHCPDRSFYFPVSLLYGIAGLLGRKPQVERLFGSLRVNDQKIRCELNWQPPYTVTQGMQETAAWLKHSQRIK